MSKKIIVSALMAVLIMAAVTMFVAAVQPFSVSAAPQTQSGDQSVQTEDVEAAQQGQTKYIEISRNINGEVLSGGVFIHYQDPDELPASDPAMFGVFTGLSGNTLSIGTGSIEVTIDVEQINDQDPVTTANAGYDGDELDVLITDNTVFYEDTTEDPAIEREEIEAGEITVTRTLEPGSADALGENMVLRIWGSMVDGQFVADVVVYEVIS